MNVVIVADIDMAEDVKVCVLGYCSEYGWEEVEVVPKPLPERWEGELQNSHPLSVYSQGMRDGFNMCLEEITE